MRLTSIPFLALVLAAAPAVLAQDIVYDSIHNATTIVGTWSSGSQAVVTGSGFADPANETFTYPKTTGISYSFSDDGFYEVARYRFVSNGTQPSCITGVVIWVHGTYDLLSNGSIVLTPMGDGFQQVQDPCAAVSNFIQDYNETELLQSWRIFQDTTAGYKLHLFQYDGSPLAPQFQVSATPNMLPTTLLRNTTSSGTSTTSSSGLTTQSKRGVSGGERSWSIGMTWLAMAATAVGMAVVGSVL